MDALRQDIHIPRAFTAFLLWAGEILQDFIVPKQALINAFYNMSSCFTSVSDGMLVSYKLYNAINADWRTSFSWSSSICQFAGLTWLAEASVLAARLVRA